MSDALAGRGVGYSRLRARGLASENVEFKLLANSCCACPGHLDVTRSWFALWCRSAPARG